MIVNESETSISVPKSYVSMCYSTYLIYKNNMKHIET